MSNVLADLFRHNVWANLKLIDICAGLTDEQLDARTPGIYGTIRETLIHSVRSETSYIARLREEEPQFLWAREDGWPGIDIIRESARRSGEAFVEYAATMDPGQRIVVRWQDGRMVEAPASLRVMQAINHATEHREQIKVALSQQGLAAPGLDGWTYWAETQLGL